MFEYSMFCENVKPKNIDEILKIADRFKISVSDKDVWSLAKKSEIPPHLGNFYMEILFYRITEAIKQKYPELTVDYFVCGPDSHLYINYQTIESFDEFNEIVITH